MQALQAPVLYFFQDVASPFLDTFFQIITMLGEEYFYILIVALFYWNISQKNGMLLGLIFIYSTVINVALKMIVMSPRPFEVLPDIHGKRLHTAGGYSFPSGHSQGSASFFTGLALVLKRPWFTWFALLLMILVALSRVYLRVHWPVDVIGGLFLGVAVGIAIWKIFQSVWDSLAKRVLYLVLLQGFAIVLWFVFVLLESQGIVRSEKMGDLFKITGTGMGAVAGYLLQIHFSSFSTEGSRSLKIIRYLVGIIGALAILLGLKALFPYTNYFNLIRYLILGLWLTFLYPWLGMKFYLFKSE